ncbi:MAG: histidine phosphatase family protein [Armatimonadetes bacterium]|nr:histidine phosphatase family protein [Armatimonadota bacterium]
MRLYLVRHGQTSWNKEGRAQGHSDTELDDDGLAQARSLVAPFSKIEVKRVLSSDLKRCAQTAACIGEATGVEVEHMKNLREQSFGSFEGSPYEVLRQHLAQVSAEKGIERYMARAAGGESFHDVSLRIEKVAATLDHGEPTVVVSHGGATSLLISHLIGAGAQAARAFRLANCSITELRRREDGVWQIVRLNDCSHLEGALEGFGAGA